MGDEFRPTSALPNLQSNQINHPRNIRGLGHNESIELFSGRFPFSIQIISKFRLSFPHHQTNYCISKIPAFQLCSYERAMNGGIALSIHSPWSNVNGVSNHACKHPRLPG